MKALWLFRIGNLGVKLEELKGIIHADPEIMGGTPHLSARVFRFRTLVDSLEGGESIEDLLDAFPTVKREQANAVIEARQPLRCSELV